MWHRPYGRLMVVYTRVHLFVCVCVCVCVCVMACFVTLFPICLVTLDVLMLSQGSNVIVAANSDGNVKVSTSIFNLWCRILDIDLTLKGSRMS